MYIWLLITFESTVCYALSSLVSFHCGKWLCRAWNTSTNMDKKDCCGVVFLYWQCFIRLFGTVFFIKGQLSMHPVIPYRCMSGISHHLNGKLPVAFPTCTPRPSQWSWLSLSPWRHEKEYWRCITQWQTDRTLHCSTSHDAAFIAAPL